MSGEKNPPNPNSGSRPPKPSYRADAVKLRQNIPQQLRQGSSWLVWKWVWSDEQKKWIKPPHDLRSGKWADRIEAARYTFEEVVTACEQGRFDGVGKFPSGAEILGDLDAKSEDPVKRQQQRKRAEEIARRLLTYTEVSPGGTGLRVAALGHAPLDPEPKPEHANLKPKWAVHQGDLEIYPASPSSNYVTFTGERWTENPGDLVELDDETVRWWYAQAPAKSNALQVLAPALKRAEFNRLSEQKFNDIYVGDWKKYAEYPSHSDARLPFLAELIIRHRLNVPAAEAEFLETPFLRGWDKGPDAWREKKKIELPKAIAWARAYVHPLVCVELNEFRAKEIPEREPVLIGPDDRPVITLQSLGQTFAKRGVGKTLFQLSVAGAIAKGENFLHWKTPESHRGVGRRVLYVEGEMSERELQERAELIGATPPGNFQLVSIDFQPTNTIRSLATDQGRHAMEELIERVNPDVVFWDSIGTLLNIATNNEDEWLPFVDWVIYLRSKYKKCFWWSMHAGKTGLQRGHSKSEDPLNISIKLEHPKDYLITDGLRADLTFDKTRGQSGSGFQALSVQLLRDSGTWVHKVADNAIRDLVREEYARNSKFNRRRLAKDLGVSHTLVNRYVNELEQASVTESEQDGFEFKEK